MFPICTYFKVVTGSEEKKAERCEASSGSETRYCVYAIDAVYSINADNRGVQVVWTGFQVHLCRFRSLRVSSK